MLRFVSRSEEQTEEIATLLADHLVAGDVLALIGELGTGKTRLVAAAAAALGYQGRVRSPTYTLLNIYRGRLPIYHFDLYRLSGGMREADLDEWDELIYGTGVSFIEWAERMGNMLPREAVAIRLYHLDENSRTVEISGPAGKEASLARHLASFQESVGNEEG